MILDINPKERKIILKPETQAEECQLRHFYQRCSFKNHIGKIEYNFDVKLNEANWGKVESLEIQSDFKKIEQELVE